MTTYPLTEYYIIERVFFIYRFLILFISTFSFLLFLNTYSIIEGLTPCQYRYFALDYVLLLSTWRRNIRLLYTMFLLKIKKMSQFEPDSPSPISVASLLINVRSVKPVTSVRISDLPYFLLSLSWQNFCSRNYDIWDCLSLGYKKRSKFNKWRLQKISKVQSV